MYSFWRLALRGKCKKRKYLNPHTYPFMSTVKHNTSEAVLDITTELQRINRGPERINIFQDNQIFHSMIAN
jgi:hypothetical protein